MKARGIKKCEKKGRINQFIKMVQNTRFNFPLLEEKVNFPMCTPLSPKDPSLLTSRSCWHGKYWSHLARCMGYKDMSKRPGKRFDKDPRTQS